MVSLISGPLLRRTVQASPSTSSADNYSAYARLQKITVAAHVNAGTSKARTRVFGRQEQFPLQPTNILYGLLVFIFINRDRNFHPSHM